MEVRFWAATDVGRTRDHNEDNFLVDKKLNLFIVADGMGGHAAGEVASSVAVREVRRVISEHRGIIEGFVREPTEPGRKAILRLVASAIEQACASVYGLAQKNAERRGMGTTLSLMMVCGAEGFIGHVGDSRIYMVRAREVHQITEDHSLINELIKRGRIKPGEAVDSPYKNAVTRAVGVYETVEVDTSSFDILPGDNFLLCSDGLSCYIDDDVTRSYLTVDDIKSIPEQFIRLANESGGKDNITAIVVRAAVEGDDAGDQRVADVKRKIEVLRRQPLFKFLNYRGLVKVMNNAEMRSFSEGSELISEGERGDALLIVVEGRLQVSIGGAKIREIESGGSCGEFALVSMAPHRHTVIAKEATRVLSIGRDALFELMRMDHVMAMKLTWSLVQLLDTQLRSTARELRSAIAVIGRLRAFVPEDEALELPSPDPFLADVGARDIAVTDEVVPPFLFSENESAGTDPLLRIVTESGGDVITANPPSLPPGALKASMDQPGPEVLANVGHLGADDSMPFERRPTLPSMPIPRLSTPSVDPLESTQDEQPAARGTKPKGRSTVKKSRQSKSGRGGSKRSSKSKTPEKS